jgi:hypothetical protein
MLRACAEIHVLLTITTAFVMKMPNDVMMHEKLSIDGFYDRVCLKHFSTHVCHSSASVAMSIHAMHCAIRRL